MKETTRQDERAPLRPSAWQRIRPWIARVVVAGLLLLSAMMVWPVAKGVWYGFVPPEPVPADQLPAWRESYAAALTESAQTGKPVLIDFTASWCPPCRTMEHEVWPDPDLRDVVAEHVIPLQLSVDDPASAAAVRRYGISTIPAILIVDAAGDERARGSFMSAGNLAAFIAERAGESVASTKLAGQPIRVGG